MERRERRHHTREFKREAVRLAGLGDKTKAKVARELGIRVNQLRQWRLEFEEEERNGVPQEELATAEQDVGKLRREIASLREENDILKNHPREVRLSAIETRLHRRAAMAPTSCPLASWRHSPQLKRGQGPLRRPLWFGIRGPRLGN